MEILARDVVVRADFHPAQAREVAFSLIGADPFVVIPNAVIDPVRVPPGMKRVPSGAFVGMDRRQRANVIAHQRHCIAFTGNHERQRPTLAFAHDNDALALARTVGGEAQILAIVFVVFRLHVAAEIGPIDFHDPIQGDPGLLFGHGLAQLVAQHVGSLVLHTEVAADLERRDALRAVHEQHDCGQQISEGQFATGKNRSRSHRILVPASLALELAASRNVIGIAAPATRAHRFAIGFRPAQNAEHRIGLVLAHLIDGLEADRARFGGKEKVLCHIIISSGVMHKI